MLNSYNWNPCTKYIDNIVYTCTCNYTGNLCANLYYKIHIL